MNNEAKLKKLMIKMDSLLEKKLKLIKQGKFDKAEEYNNKINQIISEIEELQRKKNKELEKQIRDNEKYLDEKLKELFYDKNEGEINLDEIMKGR